MPRLSRFRKGDPWRGLVLLFLLIGITACEVEGGDKKKPSEWEPAVDETNVTGPKPARHELKVHWIDINASYVITINGFPALQEYVQARSVDNEFDVQLNAGLIGKGNETEIRLEPLLTRSGEQLSIGTIELEAQVLGPDRNPIAGAEITKVQVDSAYEAWSNRARKQWSEYLEWEEQWLEENPDISGTVTARDGGALDSMRQWAARNRLTVRATFDNEAGPDFSRIFEEVPVIVGTPADSARLRDYAMHLRDLMAEKDTSGLFEEFRPAIEDRFEIQNFESRSDYMTENREAVILEDAILDFGRKDVALRKWAGGRVWELWRKKSENQAFFERPSGYGMGELYVAELDGELRVVR